MQKQVTEKRSLQHKELTSKIPQYMMFPKDSKKKRQPKRKNINKW